LNRDFQRNPGPIQVKAVKVEITREDFFQNFKRFNVVLMNQSLDIIGREYEITEDVEPLRLILIDAN
jgi:hypothetical protein